MSRQEKPVEGFQRITVDMPKNLYAELRRISFETRDSMNKIVVAIVSDNIDAYPRPAPPTDTAKADIDTDTGQG